MVRFVTSLLLVKKNESKTLSWMESDLILLPLFVLYSEFYSLSSNSKESVLADPNTCFYFKTYSIASRKLFVAFRATKGDTSP